MDDEWRRLAIDQNNSSIICVDEKSKNSTLIKTIRHAKLMKFWIWVLIFIYFSVTVLPHRREMCRSGLLEVLPLMTFLLLVNWRIASQNYFIVIWRSEQLLLVALDPLFLSIFRTGFLFDIAKLFKPLEPLTNLLFSMKITDHILRDIQFWVMFILFIYFIYFYAGIWSHSSNSRKNDII